MTHARAVFAAIALVVLPWSGFAGATAQRTFVASYGVPANTAFNCSLAKPCRAFSEAHGVTASGGEIVVLDTAGYGRVTINKSVTIAVPAGVHAAISVFGGTNGIDIPTSGIVVVLRGLAISGQGGTHGIYVTGDNALTIERCDIGGMTGNGIHLDNVSGTLQVHDTIVHDNAATGILLFGPLSASFDRVYAERNTLAGLLVIDGPRVQIKDARLIRNNRGLEVITTGVEVRVSGDGLSPGSNNHEGVRAVASGGGLLIVTLARGEIGYNPDVGVLLQTDGTSHVDATLADNVFVRNGIGVIADGGGVGGSARAMLVRNVFHEGVSNDAVNGGIFTSGGGNALGPGSLYSPPNSMFSF